MFFKKKSKLKNRFYKTSPAKYRLNKWDYFLVGLTLMVGLFIASAAQRWGADPVAESSTQPPLPEVKRVQILNACGVKNIAERVSDKITSHNPTDFYYFDVVDKANFPDFNVEESFVAYALDEQQAAAADLAHLLGLPKSRIVQQDFGENFLEIDLKVIVGLDQPAFLRRE